MQFSETLSEHVKVALAAEWMEALRTRSFEVKKMLRLWWSGFCRFFGAAVAWKRCLPLSRVCSCVEAVLTAVSAVVWKRFLPLFVVLFYYFTFST